MRRILKITAAVATLALGFTVAAIGGTAQPASATFCIQWDAHVGRAQYTSTVTPDPDAAVEEAEATLADAAVGPEIGIFLPDPDPSVICLVLKTKVVVQHG